MRRARVACIGAAFALSVSAAFLPSAAFAHNGTGPAATGTAGPYTIAAYDPGLTGDNQLSYRLLIDVTATQAGVDDATVTVAADRIGADGTASHVSDAAPATRIANVYQYQLPDPGPDNYRVTVTISAAAGAGTATLLVHGLQSATVQQPFHWKGPLLVLGGVVVAFVATTVWARRTRRPSAPDAAADLEGDES